MSPTFTAPALRYAETAAGRIAYRRAGSGPPLLLIHGWGGSSRYWLGAFAELPARHDLVAIDLPGFGASPPLAGSTTLASLAGAALALADALGLTRLALAGHSLGAAVALIVAASRPGLATRVALASFGLPRGPAEAAALAALHGQLRLGASLWSPWLALWSPWLAAAGPLRAAAWSTPPLPALLAAPVLGQSREVSASALAIGAADLAVMDARAGLESLAIAGDPAVIAAAAALRAPALVLGGHDDPLYGPDAARALQRAIPDAGLLLFERCGHIPMAELPGPFYRALATFTAP
jgi:pimeloyl-ACP methyl ester carboxylesterase